MSAHGSTAEPAERIISLLWLLLHEPLGYTREQIRRLVVGYEGLTDGAFEKLFQRDRRALRAVGVPLETVGDPDDEAGPRLRVDRDALLLQDVDFTVDERRALVRARRLWGDSPLRDDVVRAVGVLFHPGEVGGDDALEGFRTVMPRTDPRVAALSEAAAEQSVVRFSYRDAAGALTERTVRAWLLTLVRGRWYLTGWDADRAAERSFRLTRMESDPVVLDAGAASPAGEAPTLPAGHDHAALRARLAGRAEAETVRVWLAPGRGQGFRVAGRPVPATAADGPAPGPDWELWECPSGPSEDGAVAEAAVAVGQVLFSTVEAAAGRALAADLAAAAAVHAGDPDPAWRDVPLTAPTRRRSRASSEDLVGRLLDIVGLANRAEGIGRDELQERLGVTARELDADLEVLRYCGMPEREFPGFQFDVEDEGGRVRVHQSSELAGPVRLTLPEAHALVAALQTVAEMTVLTPEDREAARSAQRRIRASLADAGQSHAGSADAEAPRDGTGKEPGAVVAHWDVVADPDTVRTLLDAVAERAVVHLRYHGVRSDAVTERDVEPLAVVQDRTRLYLQAWCRRAGGPRVFRVDRIGALHRTGETFRARRVPAWDPRPAGDGVEAVVRWAHEVRDAADAYAPAAAATLDSGDRLTRVLLADDDAAVGLAARHGGRVEILAPAALRGAVRGRLEAAARRAAGAVA
ncbi:WYL domain-containing protein [Micrococcus porci]|uniref:helix-turn-helix transcriptional regulator n=1 Tax=Micrococcus TaxID=1269 RepID=UPI001CCE8884|nr:WYL domain-containing protein [Micrococcus porci]MCG7421300.1 WYL domain-containing protein [Micrococcus sp. ACRRV]UBH23854.1 WYL domain-containing protein [Micrococcus porci]